PIRRIRLGRITGAHGIRGDVVIRSFTADPADIAGYGPLTDEHGTRTFVLKDVRVTPKGAVIARIDGVSDRNGAEALAGVELLIERSRLPQPDDETEYYHADLIGLSAETANGVPIGEVVSVQNYGAGDLLEIRRSRSANTELIPFTVSFVPEVDLARRRIIVVMPVDQAEDESQS
ncbi:MAG: ribosome maturation factor RimM, partial [Hyphomicrobiaceae bacterium]